MRHFTTPLTSACSIVALLLLFLPPALGANPLPTSPLTYLYDRLDEIGNLLEENHVDSALSLATRTLNEADRQPEVPDTTLASVHVLVSSCLSHVGMFDSCEVHLTKAKSIREAVLDSGDVRIGEVHQKLGNLRISQKKFDESGPLLSRALSIYEAAYGPRHLKVASCYTSIAGRHLDMGEYADAESLFVRALNIMEDSLGTESLALADIHQRLGSLYYVTGRYDDGEQILKRAVGLFRQSGDSSDPELGNVLNSLAAIHAALGKHSEAEQGYLQALAVFEATYGPESHRLASPLNNLAVVYRKQGKYSEAERLFLRTLAIRERVYGKDHTIVANCAANLANLYLHWQKYDQAVVQFKRSIAILEENYGPDHLKTAYPVANLASLNRYQGEYAEAETQYLRALSIFEGLFGPEHSTVNSILGGLAVLHGSSGDYTKSLHVFQRRLDIKQELREYAFSLLSEKEKVKWVKQRPHIDNSFLSLALLYDSPEARSSALEMVLKGKALVIEALMAEREVAYCSEDPVLTAQLEELSRVTNLIAGIALAKAPTGSPTDDRDSLMALFSIKDSLEADLSRRCAKFRTEAEIREVNPAVVATHLPRDAVLWEYVLYRPYDFSLIGRDVDKIGDIRYLAFSLDHGGEIALMDIGSASVIDSLVRATRRMISQSGPDLFSSAAAYRELELTELTRELHGLLFAPLQAYLGDRKTILIAADGLLNLLPFEILPVSEDRYVIEDFHISYLSTGRDLCKFEDGQHVMSKCACVLADPDFALATFPGVSESPAGLLPDERPIAFRSSENCLDGPFSPLPHTRIEATRIVETASKSGELLVYEYYGDKALEESVKGLASAPRFLHLATHGYFCADADNASKVSGNPLLRSGLALAGANLLTSDTSDVLQDSDDGILTAFEVSCMNLVGTELVALSACESGMGELVQGEGVFGLRRALQHAGAESILMSLWSIPDRETAELMAGFYERWLGGQTKRVALRESALQILNQSRKRFGHGHPLLWGGFVLVGNPN